MCSALTAENEKKNIYKSNDSVAHRDVNAAV